VPALAVARNRQAPVIDGERSPIDVVVAAEIEITVLLASSTEINFAVGLEGGREVCPAWA